MADRDPAHPGIPVNLDQLKKQPRKDTRPPLVAEPPPPPPAAPATKPPPAAIPDSFEAGEVAKPANVHPLLRQLNQEFGLERLKVDVVELGGHRWAFRPKDYSALEWVTERITVENQGKEAITGVSAVTVAAHLALVDGVPVYELFGVDVTGRHIADPANPPVDLKRQASEAVLSWLRGDVGLTEIIEELEGKFSVAHERQRREAYPLWARLASTYHQMLVSLDEQPPTKETTGNDLPIGDGVLPSQELSLPTSGLDSSGLAPTL